jgi:hypothetical protein
MTLTISATRDGTLVADRDDLGHDTRLHVRVAVNGVPVGAAYTSDGVARPPVVLAPGARVVVSIEETSTALAFVQLGQVAAGVDENGALTGDTRVTVASEFGDTEVTVTTEGVQ